MREEEKLEIMLNLTKWRSRHLRLLGFLQNFSAYRTEKMRNSLFVVCYQLACPSFKTDTGGPRHPEDEYRSRLKIRIRNGSVSRSKHES